MELNKIYCGDCVDIMKTFPDECIDLTVTSPPYDNLRTYNGFSFNFEEIAQELYRVTKPGGNVVWVAGDQTKKFCESLTSFKQAIYFVEKCGFNLLDTMIYHKDKYAPAYPTIKRYANQFEYMFVLSKGKPKTFNPIQKPKARNKKEVAYFRQKDGSQIRKEIEKRKETKDASNVWLITTGGSSTKDKFAYKHPAIFPEQLAQDHILSWSNEGDVILDPMCGSGTTLKMAKLNNREYIGIDLSKEYCEIAEQRVSL